MPINNTKDLIDEYELKALATGLEVVCPADGIFNSEIAIVAEAPGEREVLAKSPLVGGSGKYLWDNLRKYGFNRNNFYVTNVCKRQVAFEQDERRAPLGKHEFDQWAELLRWELSQLPNVRIIVALGNFALKALTGNDGITNWRGSVIPVTLRSFGEAKPPRLVQVICTFNPAAILRNPKDELIFHLDLGRVKRVVDGQWREHKVNVHINPSFRESREFLQHLRGEGKPVAHDIETLGGETACIGFANNPNEAMCINFRTQTEHRFTLEEELVLRREIQDFYDDPNVAIIGQNNMFDSSWLWFKDKIKVKPAWFDTMLAHHTLYPLMPHNLGFLTTQYTTHPYYKDDGKTWKETDNINQYWTYNGTDCCMTWACAAMMLKELKAQHLDDFFFNHVMRLQPHLIRMTVGGVKIDEPLREGINASLREDLERYKANFYQAVQEATGLTDYYPNPNSPVQLSDLLFNKLRLVGRGAKTDEENRKRMYKDHRTSEKSRKVLDALHKYKEESKFFSTYVDTAIDEDGRMRSEYKQTGVQRAPGRLSSSKTLWGHYDSKERTVIQHGANLQNQPKRAYEMFIADKGGAYWNGEEEIDYEDYTFVYFDLSQAEARYVGWDAEIPQWIEDFEKARLDGKYDAHRALASSMFNIPYDDVPTDDIVDGVKSIRYIAKRCRHGLNYRMMPDRLASTTELPINEAQRAFELYHRTTPQLSKKWWPSLIQQAKETRYLYNSYGRRLFIQGRMDDEDTLASVVAFRPQSTIGDKVSRVIYQCHEDDEWPIHARMALNIHDALIALVPKRKVGVVARIMKKYAEEPIIVKPSMPPLIIPADIAVAKPDKEGQHRWSTLQKMKSLDQIDQATWINSLGWLERLN